VQGAAVGGPAVCCTGTRQLNSNLLCQYLLLC